MKMYTSPKIEIMSFGTECVQAAAQASMVTLPQTWEEWNYSPNLMRTQIKAIDDLLMGMKYFGE